MLSQPEQALQNLEEARGLRAAGTPYREIRRKLGLSAGQLGHIRRALKREKGARTRLHKAVPEATDRDLPVSQSVLPSGLRKRLTASGYHTLGDLADRLADPDFPGLETMPGIGPHRARLVKGLLDHFGCCPARATCRPRSSGSFPNSGRRNGAWGVLQRARAASNLRASRPLAPALRPDVQHDLFPDRNASSPCLQGHSSCLPFPFPVFPGQRLTTARSLPIST